MPALQDYSFGSPLSPCQGGCGRGVHHAAEGPLCPQCRRPAEAERPEPRKSPARKAARKPAEDA